MEGHKHRVIIIGGGAAGIFAAISAKQAGCAGVILCERTSQPGKKILASGNGRCNLLNDKLDSSFYNAPARPLVGSVLAQFGKDDIKNFFERLGLKTYSEGGRIFPATNQSSSVLKILDMELKRLSVPVELGFEALSVTGSAGGFNVTSRSGKSIWGRTVILACGGKTYPSFGSDGTAYGLAKHFGHTIVEPVPVAVPLVVKDPMCHNLQGQKIYARTKCLIGGKMAAEAAGDILFTKYGLSGTSVIDISQEVSIAINRHKRSDVTVSIDMVPFEDEAALTEDIVKRLRVNTAADDLLAGILPNKFGSALRSTLKTRDPALIAKELKDKRFKVAGTKGWNEADFTAGGIDLKEVNENSLESKLKKGLYFAGEMLDVDGRRGGYNLAWAWASGHVAAEAASHA